jgi:hypothetical protein
MEMMRTNHNFGRFALLIGTSLAILGGSAGADPVRVQRPAMHQEHAQRVEHRQRIRQARLPVRAEGVSARIERLDLSTPQGRRALAETPLVERAMHYVAKAREAGFEINHAFRTLRGRNTANKHAQVPVTEAKKLFVEVTPQTFGLFNKFMTQNVVWPSGASNAGHLYTMIADQAGGGQCYSNTYGDTMTAANAANANNKLAAGVLLSDSGMDRLVRLLNAGIEHRRAAVHGMKMGDGTYPTPSCTNWFSAAPIGEVVDAKVETARADREARWPQRPADLDGRKPLAKEFGLSRAQHPGIWMGKSVLAPSMPVLAVFSASPGSKSLSDLAWGLKGVGNLEADGNVSGGAQVYVPREPPPAATPVTPDRVATPAPAAAAPTATVAPAAAIPTPAAATPAPATATPAPAETPNTQGA